MADLIDAVSQLIQDHWLKALVAVLFTAAGWWIGKRRAAAQWKKREFLGRVNFSLNTIEDGKLLIRTLCEKSCEEVFLNQVASEKVISAAKQCTTDDPTIPLEQDEYWFYLNPVLNELSEQFAEGLVRRDLGLPVKRATYLIALTCEVSGEMRTRKIRAMIIHKPLFENLPEEEPIYEAPTHKTRWKTLKALALLHKTHPWRFHDVELCFAEK